MERAAFISNLVELQLGVTMSAAVNLVGSQDSAEDGGSGAGVDER